MEANHDRPSNKGLDAVFWITLACVGLLCGLYVTHMRNCDETRLDAKSSAADELKSDLS